MPDENVVAMNEEPVEPKLTKAEVAKVLFLTGADAMENLDDDGKITMGEIIEMFGDAVGRIKEEAND